MKLRLFVCLTGLEFGALAIAQTPVVTDVLDGGGYSANIARGGIFVVKGTNLSGGGYASARVPLDTTIGGTGVKISLTPVGVGSSVDAYLVYTYNVGGVNQLAAILPSSLSPMTYNLTVTYNGVSSAPFQTMVVDRKFRLLTVSGSGRGRAVVQNFISQSQLDVNRFTKFASSGYTFSPAHPGQTLIAWGTGLGAIQKPDNDYPGVIDFSNQVPIKVYVGSVAITAAYAGRAPQLPGADQVNFALPADIPTGCTVPFVVSGGQMSNPTTIAISPVGSDVCSTPPFSADLLRNLDQGGTMTAAFVRGGETQSYAQVGQMQGMQDTRRDEFFGGFSRYTADQLSDVSVFLSPPTGYCQVFQRHGSNYVVMWGGNGSYLDAGSLAVIGGGINLAMSRLGEGFYDGVIGTWINPTPGMPVPPGYGTTPLINSPGPYTVKGDGGAEIGAFQISATASTGSGSGGLTKGLPIDVVSRNTDLTISWTATGVNPAIPLYLIGSSGVAAGADSTGEPMYDATVFACSATLDKGSIVVPAMVLQQLPAATANNYSRLALITGQISSAANGLFTVPLVAGGNLDAGIMLLGSGFGQRPIFQ